MTDYRTLDDEIALREVVSTIDVDNDHLPVLIGGVVKIITGAALATMLAATHVEDTIADGVTDKAPSQNAVYDALALKQPLNSNLTTLAGVTPGATGLALLDDTSESAARTTLGLGTAALVNTGTSGATIPLLNGNNTASGAWDFTQTIQLGSSTGFVHVGGTGGSYMTLSFNGTMSLNGGTAYSILNTNSSATLTGTLTGGTYASPTLSGTVAGSVTASGVWTHTNNIHLSYAAPQLRFVETDGGTNNQNWIDVIDGGVRYFQIYNDAFSAALNWLTVTRSTHVAATVNFNPGGGVTVQVGGSAVLTAATGAQLGVANTFTTGPQIIAKTGAGNQTQLILRNANGGAGAQAVLQFNSSGADSRYAEIASSNDGSNNTTLIFRPGAGGSLVDSIICDYVNGILIGQDVFPVTTEVTSLGSASKEWLNIYSQNAVTVSDMRHKNDCGLLSSGVAGRLLQGLIPRWFTRKTGEELHAGFFAQEVLGTLEECGIRYALHAYEAEDDIHVLRPMELLAPLVAGWQDHEARLQRLETTLVVN